MFYSVDFGTCNSVISFINENQDINHIYDPINGNVLIPTTIYFNKMDIEPTTLNFEYKKHYYIGTEANENFLIYKNVDCYFYQFKRFLGLTSKSNKSEFDFIKKLNIKYELDEDNIYLFIPSNVEDKYVKISIINLVSLYIKGLCFYMNDNKHIKEIYATGPAYFNDLQKSQLLNAYKNANCKVLKYYNEPTAATVYYLNTYYKNEIQGSKKIAILDIGGGTTDITVIEYDFENKICDIVDVSGNNNLGGVDIDNVLIEDIYKNYFIDVDNKKWRKKINEIAENIKIQLSLQYSYKVILEEVPLKINNKLVVKEILEIQYTRTQFNTLISNITNNLFKLLQNIQESHEIFDIIPIGGTTQIPIIYEKINIHKNINNEYSKNYLYKTIVSDGASLMCKIINNKDDFMIMDITPMDLFIKTNNNYLCVIPKNTKIPTTKEYILTTNRDAQRSIEIDIYEGDDKFNIGSYTIVDIPPFNKGSILITLYFKINCSGLMNITVKGCVNKANEKGSYELEKEIKIISNNCIKNIIKKCLIR
jgi:molecular chaperone DnaK (HSP70)